MTQLKYYFLGLALILACTVQAQPGAATDPDQVVEGSDRLSVDGQPISYDTRAGYVQVEPGEDGKKAKVYFTAYHLQGVDDPAERPLTFVFNGGPGSSSVWLHMGGLGPKRVNLNEDGSAPEPPYGYSDNPHTWLDQTDLVFIDPMMTGYSRPAGDTDKKAFLGFEPDLALVGEFIRLYLTRYERWASPKFIAGESYGTTRASALSHYLQERYGLYVNGLMLISSVLDFSTIIGARGNDLAPLTVLPTMAATAWYHQQVDAQYETLEDLLVEVEKFAMNDYALALLKGDALTEEEKGRIIDQLHAFTGLDTAYLADVHLRLSVGSFNKELLRDQGYTVGRLDSRFKGVDYSDDGGAYEYDPSYDRVIYGPFTTALYDYLRRDLGYKNDLPYEILTGRARPWPYGRTGANRYVNVAEMLRQAMSKNPDMKVWIASGYYDMATPYFATDYTLDHMFLRDGLKDNVQMTYYPTGHMVYIHQPSLVRLKQHLKTFIEEAK